jgi:hypothetical protein
MPLFNYLSTREAAVELRIPFQRLQNAMHAGHLPFPSHMVGGCYLWSPGDIKIARKLIPTLRIGKGRPRKDETKAKVSA